MPNAANLIVQAPIFVVSEKGWDVGVSTPFTAQIWCGAPQRWSRRGAVLDNTEWHVIISVGRSEKYLSGCHSD